MADGGRYYERNGRKYVSVTTLLGIIHKPGLEAWKLRVGGEEAKKLATAGADKGTQFHFIVDQLLSKKYVWESETFQKFFVQQDEQVQAMVSYWREWYSKQTDKVISTERIVFSELYGYAGQLDAETDKRIWDWKTSNYPSTEWVLQTHLYSFATAEEEWFKKNPNTVPLTIDIMDYLRPKDIAIYNAQKKEPTKPRVFEVPFDWGIFDVAVSALKLFSFQRDWKYPTKNRRKNG